MLALMPPSRETRDSNQVQSWWRNKVFSLTGWEGWKVLLWSLQAGQTFLKLTVTLPPKRALQEVGGKILCIKEKEPVLKRTAKKVWDKSKRSSCGNDGGELEGVGGGGLITTGENNKSFTLSTRKMNVIRRIKGVST